MGSAVPRILVRNNTMSGWTPHILGQADPQMPAEHNRAFKDLHKRRLDWEKKEPKLPSPGGPDKEHDPARRQALADQNKAWSDWHESKPMIGGGGMKAG